MLTWWPIPSRSDSHESFPSRNRTCAFPRIRLEPPVSIYLAILPAEESSFRYWDFLFLPEITFWISTLFIRSPAACAVLLCFLNWHAILNPEGDFISVWTVLIKSGHWWPSLPAFTVNHKILSPSLQQSVRFLASLLPTNRYQLFVEITTPFITL